MHIFRTLNKCRKITDNSFASTSTSRDDISLKTLHEEVAVQRYHGYELLVPEENVEVETSESFMIDIGSFDLKNTIQRESFLKIEHILCTITYPKRQFKRFFPNAFISTGIKNEEKTDWFWLC